MNFSRPFLTCKNTMICEHDNLEQPLEGSHKDSASLSLDTPCAAHPRYGLAHLSEDCDPAVFFLPPHAWHCVLPLECVDATPSLPYQFFLALFDIHGEH